MMSPIRSLLLSACLAAMAPSYGQGTVRDTSIRMVPVTMSYAYQVPGGTMAERFGNNNNLGLSAMVKFQSNYLIGAEGQFLFSRQVREPGLLNGVTNSFGQIIDQEGQPATVLLFQRGYLVMGVVGKIIPIVGPNPNSGLLLKLGGGYMRHKIRIETQVNEVPQLENDHLDGYDRLAAGPCAMLFVGYQHFGNKRRVNFTIGFESTYGFTSPLRAINFDTGTSDRDGRLDALYGLRAGWTLPIYRRKADSFYIY